MPNVPNLPGQTPPPKIAQKKIPGFVWGTLIIMVCASLACFTVAILLAPHWPPKLPPLHEAHPGSPKKGLVPTTDNQHGQSSLMPEGFPTPARPANGQSPAPIMPASATEPVLPAAVSSSLPANLMNDGSSAALLQENAEKMTANISEFETTPAGAPSNTAPAATATSFPTEKRAGNLALVIDDMSLDAPDSLRAIEILPAPVTFAFLTYAPAAVKQAELAANQGHQVIVHIPMQPIPHNGVQLNPGPNTLMVSDTAATITEKLAKNLAPLASLAIGANNHMGSAFTQSAAGMTTVLTALNQQKLAFLDSRTIAHTAVPLAAQQAHFSQPLYTRDVFLDDTPTPAAIQAQLARAVTLAQQRGTNGPNGGRVIAIGHPHPATLLVLQALLPGLESHTGIHLVPLVPKP